MKTIYAVRKNSDQIEGRGVQEIIEYFFDNFQASHFADSIRTRYIIGLEIIPIAVYDSYEEYNDKNNSDLKIKALAKLTLEEKRSLGLVV